MASIRSSYILAETISVQYMPARRASYHKKKRARVSRPASLLQVAWSKPPVGGKPMLEGVDQGPEQYVLSLPLVLLVGKWIYRVIVGERVMIGIVMAIFCAHQQSGSKSKSSRIGWISQSPGPHVA